MMKLSSDILKEKVKFLGYGVSKANSIKQSVKMIRIQNKGDVVYAYTYDDCNNIQVELGKTDTDIFAIMEFALFESLVKSSEGDVTLNVKDKSVEFKTPYMKCLIPIYDKTPDNCAIPIPKTKQKYEYAFEKTFDLGLLRGFVNPNNYEETYQNIYFGDSILATDTINVIRIASKIFPKTCMLSLKSIELLCSLTNCLYSIDNNLLCIKSDELVGTVQLYSDSKFRADKFINLFDGFTGATVMVNSELLTKAMNTAMLFKKDPILVFNDKGIFVQIDSVGFVYRIANTACEPRKCKLTPTVAKMLAMAGDNVKVYYTNKGLLKCENNEVSEIFCVSDVANA